MGRLRPQLEHGVSGAVDAASMFRAGFVVKTKQFIIT